MTDANKKTLAAATVLTNLWRHRRILFALSADDLKRRYAGSYLGKLWVVLFPLLFLCVYLFVYLVVFRVKFPGYSELDYVVFVFSGLVPYLGFMEATVVGTASIKQNIHLIRNIVVPIDLIPARVVVVSLVTMAIGLGLVVVLSFINGTVGLDLLILIPVLGLYALFLLGVIFAVAAVGALVPDVGYFVNLGVLLLLFVSPIAFKPEMVPDGLAFVLYFNPIYYVVESFRAALISNHPVTPAIAVVTALGSVAVFVASTAVFRRIKNELMDYV